MRYKTKKGRLRDFIAGNRVDELPVTMPASAKVLKKVNNELRLQKSDYKCSSRNEEYK